jgi:hypothetical protein
MSKFINVKDLEGERNVTLSIGKDGIFLLGCLNHNTRLGISPEDAKALIELLKPLAEGFSNED